MACAIAIFAGIAAERAAGGIVPGHTPAGFQLLMVYSARPGRAGASDAIYRRASASYVRVDVRDTRHLDFSDMTFWGGPLRERGALGALAPARAVGIARAIVREYFDETIRRRPSALLGGRSRFPEVSITPVPR